MQFEPQNSVHFLVYLLVKNSNFYIYSVFDLNLNNYGAGIVKHTPFIQAP